MLKEHITGELYIPPEDRTAPEEDHQSWTTAAVGEELARIGATTLERSRRHGLSDVVIALHALSPRQQLAHLTTVRRYIGAANHDRTVQGIGPNNVPRPGTGLPPLTRCHRKHRRTGQR